MQGAVIAGCLVYLGYLSWQILLFAVLTLGVAAIGFRVVHARAISELHGSRRREDDLVRYFRALFDGAKELKLPRAHTRAFIDETLAPNTAAVLFQRTREYIRFHTAPNMGHN